MFLRFQIRGLSYLQYTKLNVQQTNMISLYLPQVRHSPVLEGLVAAVVDIAVKVGGRMLGNDVTDVAQQHRLLPSRLQVSQKPTHTRHKLHLYMIP